MKERQIPRTRTNDYYFNIIMEGIEKSLFNIQRTYQQSPQPRLNQRVFQTIVHGCQFDKVTLNKLAPSIPIYVKKQQRQWKPKEERASSLRIASRSPGTTKRCPSISNYSNTVPMTRNSPYDGILDLIKQQKLNLQKKQFQQISKLKTCTIQANRQETKKQLIMIPKFQPKQQIDQITLTPW